jgi:two-component system, OmpR family, sensor kinase
VTRERRLLSILEPLFEIGPAALDVVLDRCADLVAEGIRSDKVDAFLYDAATASLVAIGTSHTPLAALQRQLGLNRLALANGDPMAKVFETGQCYRTGRAEEDPTHPPGVIEKLGVRSMVAAPIDVAGVRRGVLSLAATQNDAFTEDDLALVRIIAVWAGSLVHRSELVSEAAARAKAEGRRAAAEELVTVLAHDVRNLLHPIVTRISLMRDRAAEEARAHEAEEATRALAGLGRLSAIVTDLLDVARLDTGMLQLKQERMDLVSLLRVTAETMRPPDVDVRVDSFCEQLHILADGERLRQAIENVLSNAVKHSPRAAAVVLSIEPTRTTTQEAAKIVICDQGPGIEPELLPRIFDRFVSDGRSAGLGLGLFLARAIVVAHGGTIDMQSVLGQGTRCEIVLPSPRVD